MNQVKILVLVQDYPDCDGHIAMAYVHTRNLYYQQHGIDITVLSFNAESSYYFEGIHVISFSDFQAEKEKYSADVLLLHAANIRNHYRFLKRYGKQFKKFLFFYHGHEVLKINKVYSKPFLYQQPPRYKVRLQDAYDWFKLFVWRHYIPTIVDKSHFVFVSEWMREEFFKWTKIKRELLSEISTITYNCVSPEFEQGCYCSSTLKDYDFITIRGNLDGSKYCVDIVNKLAHITPDAKFLLIGKGEFFNHYDKAPNLTWIDSTLTHPEIIKYLDRAKFALMPTRTDAQGLMMCEMAAYGIPLITSDIPVCHEIFDEHKNVYFIDNSANIGLTDFLNVKSLCRKDTQYFKEKTIGKELSYLLTLAKMEK